MSKIIPPEWKPGDRWTVAMKTPAPVPAEMRPSYEENVFEFRVDSVPDARNSTYRIEASSRGGRVDGGYFLYYRRDPFSLLKVTRYSPDEGERTVLQNGEHPCIYYERRLPVIPDFFITEIESVSALREFRVGAYHLVQEILVTDDMARITLDRLEQSGSVRAVMYWAAGDPWWSRIECTENPPPGAPFPGYVVASGTLLKGAAAG